MNRRTLARATLPGRRADLPARMDLESVYRAAEYLDTSSLADRVGRGSGSRLKLRPESRGMGRLVRNSVIGHMLQAGTLHSLEAVRIYSAGGLLQSPSAGAREPEHTPSAAYNEMRRLDDMYGDEGLVIIKGMQHQLGLKGVSPFIAAHVLEDRRQAGVSRFLIMGTGETPPDSPLSDMSGFVLDRTGVVLPEDPFAARPQIQVPALRYQVEYAPVASVAGRSN